MRRRYLIHELGAELTTAEQGQQLLSVDFSQAMQEYVRIKSMDRVPPEAAQRMRDLGAAMEKGAERTEKKVMREAIRSAAVSTALQLTLNAVPVVGQALAAAASLVGAFAGSRYTDRCREYAQKRAKELEQFVAGYQQRLNDALTSAYRSAHRGAIELALSNQPLEDIDLSAGRMVNPGTYQGKIDGYVRTTSYGLGIIDKMTGRDVWLECKKQVDRQIEEAKRTIREALEPQIQMAKSRGFRDVLRLKVAQEMRNQPALLLYYKTHGPTSPQDYVRSVLEAEAPYREAALPRGDSQGLSTGAKLALAAGAAGTAYLLLKG